jgi:hypothetical protein
LSAIQPPGSVNRYTIDVYSPYTAPAVASPKPRPGFVARHRCGHEEDQQRAHAVVAEALPHLGEEQRRQAARMTEECRLTAHASLSPAGVWSCRHRCGLRIAMDSSLVLIAMLESCPVASRGCGRATIEDAPIYTVLRDRTPRIAARLHSHTRTGAYLPAVTAVHPVPIRHDMDTSIVRMLPRCIRSRASFRPTIDYLAGHARTIGYLPWHLHLPREPAAPFLGHAPQGPRRAAKGPRARPRVMYVMGPGDSFGEGSLLDDYPHSTSALRHSSRGGSGDAARCLAHIAAGAAGALPPAGVGAARMIADRLSSPTTGAGRGESYISGEVRRRRTCWVSATSRTANYYGIQTLRAVENFPITGIPIAQYPHLIKALAAVKEAAAEANRELGLLDDDVADAIIAACREIRTATCTASSSWT